jgi:class 3 adenylate cyclase/tetratricopeptide (TPR) repeat protein
MTGERFTEEPTGSGPVGGYTPGHLSDEAFHTRTALEGERKNVTVVFCDIVNSTGLAERYGPEAMHELFETFFSRAVGLIHGTGGTINQFLGDGFMALFGAPLAAEDHARRAVSAAWDVLTSMRRAPLHIGGDDGPTLDVRLGLNTGSVVVGSLGDDLRMDYTAIGDTTNLAARLQAAAEPGTAYLSAATVQASGGWAWCTALGERRMKGKSKPVAVFRLEDVRPPVEVEGVPTVAEAPLSGRTDELTRLERAVEDLSSGRGAFVSVHGEAGIGKSRLVAETRARIDAARIRWLEGRSPEFGESTGYVAIRDVLRASAGIEDQASNDEAWHRLKALSDRLLPASADEVLPFLATLLGLPLSEPSSTRLAAMDQRAIGNQVLLSTRRFVHALAVDTPTVIVFEDVHRLDRSSEEMLEHLLPLVEGAPLLVVATAREGAEQLARLGVVTRDRTIDIALAPLATTESERLLSSLAGGVSIGPARRASTIRRAGGNPFFLGELARSLADVGEAAADDDVPGDVQDVIMARVDRLDDASKEVLRTASVVGYRAPIRILEAVVDRPPDQLRNIVSTLQERDLVRTQGKAPDTELTFTHALVQEAVSGSILTARRRDMHRRVGEAIEQGYADRLPEFYGPLASHFTEAEDWDRAQEYLLKAGDEAGRVAADAEALSNYERALDTHSRVLGDRWDPVARATLDRKIGDALFRLGHHEQAIERLELALVGLGDHYPGTRSAIMRAIGAEVAEQAVARRRPRGRAPTVEGPRVPAVEEIYRTYRALAWMDYFIDPVRFVLDTLRTLNLSEKHRVPMGVVHGAAGYGLALDVLGRPKLASHYLDRAMREAEHLDRPNALSEARLGRAVHDFVGGRVAIAEEGFAASARAYDEAGDLRGWGITRILEAWAIHLQGGYARSLVIVEEVLRTARDAAEPELEAWAMWERGRTLCLAGTLDEAVTSCSSAIELLRGVPAPVDAIDAMSDLGLCYLRQDRVDLALETFDEATSAAAEAGARGYKVTQLRTYRATALVAALEHAGTGPRRATRARKACRAAIRNTKRVPLGRPQAYRALGTYRWLRGRHAAAMRSWRRSVEDARRMGMPHQLALTELEIGRMGHDTERLVHAAAVFDEMGATFDRARALEELARLT